MFRDGKKENREHYHFVALCSKNIEKNSWKYGFDDYREIHHTIADMRIAKNYLLKLNNHSYKDTTREKRIIMNKTRNDIDYVEGIIKLNFIEYSKFRLEFLK